MEEDNSYSGNYVISGSEFVDSTNEESISKFDVPNHIVLFYDDIKLVPNKVFLNWKKLNPDYKLIFFNFIDAEYFLEKKLGIEYKNHFIKITFIPHRCDFFRLCFLYIYGGIYSDIDNVPLQPINTFFKPFNDVTFCTALSLENDSFAQAIIYSTRQNKYLDVCIKAYLTIFKSFEKLIDYSGQDLSGTRIMYNAIKKILIENKQISRNVLAHCQYIIYNDIDNKRFVNKLVLLDEYTPTGRWQDCCMRTAFDTVIKSRYDDYPWFNKKIR
jgi:mannosyltransferase OCH1-like enzyme